MDRRERRIDLIPPNSMIFPDGGPVTEQDQTSMKPGESVELIQPERKNRPPDVLAGEHDLIP